MQKPFTYSSIHSVARDSFISRRQISVIAFAGVMVLFLISLALVGIHYRSSAPAAHNTPSSVSEFSSGMPLP